MKSHYDEKFWAEYFETYDVVLKVIPYRELLQHLVDAAVIHPQHNLLDAGAGTGNLLYHLPKGIAVTLFDQSPEALTRARSKHNNPKTIHGNLAENLPFEEHCFDTIICNNVLYTLPKEVWSSFIVECKRVLRPGGRIILSNISIGFSVMTIYKDHILKSINRKGWIYTMSELIALSRPTFKMFRYNAKLKHEHATGQYHFVTPGEQRELLLKAGLLIAHDERSVYAGQAIMVCGQKP